MRERLEDLRLEPPKSDSLVERTLRTTLRLHCLHHCDISQVYSRHLQGQTWTPLVGIASGHREGWDLEPLVRQRCEKAPSGSHFPNSSDDDPLTIARNFDEPCWDRTNDPQLKRLLLYQLS